VRDMSMAAAASIVSVHNNSNVCSAARDFREYVCERLLRLRFTRRCQPALDEVTNSRTQISSAGLHQCLVLRSSHGVATLLRPAVHHLSVALPQWQLQQAVQSNQRFIQTSI
jgi:hypothetical protein